MAENLMDQARRALAEERNEDAQALLINVIAREPEHEDAWLLLAEAIADPGKKRECLERAQAINPRNRAILHALASLDGAAPDHAAAPAAEAVADPAATAEPVPAAS